MCCTIFGRLEPVKLKLKNKWGCAMGCLGLILFFTVVVPVIPMIYWEFRWIHQIKSLEAEIRRTANPEDLKLWALTLLVKHPDEDLNEQTVLSEWPPFLPPGKPTPRVLIHHQRAGVSGSTDSVVVQWRVDPSLLTMTIEPNERSDQHDREWVPGVYFKNRSK